MNEQLFTGWAPLLRILVVGSLAYVTMIITLRIFGKRTLSKMYAFDLVVTIALGSTLSSVLLDRQISLAEGAVAMALLVFLQFVVSWTSIRVTFFRHLVTSEPQLLFFRGKFLNDAMRGERVSEADLRSAARDAGCSAFVQVEAIVLETDGSMSIVTYPDKNPSPEGNDLLPMSRALSKT